jgi:hypothetical protein
MFGDFFKTILTGPIDDAHKAADDLIDRTEPMIVEAENRLARIAHSLLDRFTVDITIKLNPYARAASVEDEKKRELK